MEFSKLIYHEKQLLCILRGDVTPERKEKNRIVSWGRSDAEYVKSICSNAERNEETGDLMCKATGYCCRYVPSDPSKIKSPCLFDEIFSRNSQIKQMLAMIHSVQVGSTVVVPFKRRYGWYTREVIDSSLGTVLKINKYGCMEIDVHAWKGTWNYNLEDFTRTIYLEGKEIKEKLEAAQDEMDEQERIRAERREDGRESEE